MRNVTGPLLALINTGDFQSCDLWTLTLSGGNVVRWSGADIPLTVSGQTFPLGPVIQRNAIKESLGLEIANLDITLNAKPTDLINGTPIIPFIRGRGFDGANLKLERAFMPNWGDPVTGTINRFSGKVTSIGDIGGSTAVFSAASWLILLGVKMPPNVYQSGCMHMVYDAGCTLNPASFAGSGTISGNTGLVLHTNLSQTTGYYSQGRLVITSGANSGLQRTVRLGQSGGDMTLTNSFPAPIAPGTTFTAYPGCDLTHPTCLSKFNNQVHFKGTPFVPVPETAV